MQNVQVRLHQDARKAFDALDDAQRRKLMAWKERLEADPTVGDQLNKQRIPKVWRTRYALTNLWRLPLVGGWRLLYTIVSHPADGAATIILWIGDHKQYDRLLGYATS
ncbi:MAG: type II toxin-antitoxin system RelE family toxin [Thermoplasmatota archaeon]